MLWEAPLRLTTADSEACTQGQYGNRVIYFPCCSLFVALLMAGTAACREHLTTCGVSHPYHWFLFF